VFYESSENDIPLWTHGTAAKPYLEKGTFSMFAQPQTIGRINLQFGGVRFFVFSLWFN
jgi:hypothetical protein